MQIIPAVPLQAQGVQPAAQRPEGAYMYREARPSFEAIMAASAEAYEPTKSEGFLSDDALPTFFPAKKAQDKAEINYSAIFSGLAFQPGLTPETGVSDEQTLKQCSEIINSIVAVLEGKAPSTQMDSLLQKLDSLLEELNIPLAQNESELAREITARMPQINAIIRGDAPAAPQTAETAAEASPCPLENDNDSITVTASTPRAEAPKAAEAPAVTDAPEAATDTLPEADSAANGEQAPAATDTRQATPTVSQSVRAPEPDAAQAPLEPAAPPENKSPAASETAQAPAAQAGQIKTPEQTEHNGQRQIEQTEQSETPAQTAHTARNEPAAQPEQSGRPVQAEQTTQTAQTGQAAKTVAAPEQAENAAQTAPQPRQNGQSEKAAVEPNEPAPQAEAPAQTHRANAQSETQNGESRQNNSDKSHGEAAANTAFAASSPLDIAPMRAQAAVAPETPAAPQATRETLLDTMVEQMTLSTAEGVSTVEIELRPDYLGKVSIELSLDQHGLQAKIRADDPGVKNLIGGQINQLIDQLNQKGVRVNELEVVYTGPQTQSFEQGGREASSGQHRQNRGSARNRLPKTLGAIAFEAQLEPKEQILPESATVQYRA